MSKLFHFWPITFCLSLLLLIPSAQAKTYRVGVLYWSKNIPGQVAMSQGLEEEARKYPDLQLLIKVAGDGPEGMENQIRQMKELIEQKVDILIVQPTDNAALAEPLRLANQAGIKVVAYDQYISGGQLSGYRTSDNYQAGFLNGEYIVSKMSHSKEIRIILVEYPHVSSTVERVNGFLDALNQSGQKYRILKSYIAVEPVSGKKAGKEILKDFPTPGKVDVIFTVNDGGGLAVVDELIRAGRKEISVATIDGDPKSVAYIKAGKSIVIDSAQFCGPLGAEALKTAYALLRHTKTPYHALVPTFPITQETLAFYPGWKGPIPKAFKKPWKSITPEWKGEIRVVNP